MAFPDIDPVIFSIGPFALRWYALAYIVGILGGIQYTIRLAQNNPLWGDTTPPSAQHLQDFVLWAVIGVILGGRLGYVLFYNLDFYLAHPDQIFAIWQGGMSFHGGLSGVAVAWLAFTYRRGLSVMSFGDLISCAAPIGLFFGRIANFINGELWGRTSDVPWAVVFPRGGPIPRHPSQLYEALLEGVVLFVLLRIAIFYFGALKKPGRVSAMFLMGYGIARFFVEFFREPDYQLGFIAGFLTMGMILSLPMMIIGAILYVRTVR